MRQSANKEWKHKQQQTPASEEINKKGAQREKELKLKSNQIVSTADANQRQPSNRMRLFVFDLFGNKLNASISVLATLLFLLL